MAAPVGAAVNPGSSGVLSSIPQTVGNAGNNLFTTLFGSAGQGAGGLLGDIGSLVDAGMMAYLTDVLFNRSTDVYNMQTQAAKAAMNPSQTVANASAFANPLLGSLPGQISNLTTPILNDLPGQIANLTTPLQNELVQNVWNQAAPTLAASGLSTSPGMATAILGQGLAPYSEQNLQMANADVMNTLGMSSQNVMNLLNQGANSSMTGYQFPFEIGSALAGYTPFAGNLTGNAGNPFSAISGIASGLSGLFGTGTP